MSTAKPLGLLGRAENYHRQRTGRPMRLGSPMADLTPPQMRRIWHKERRAWRQLAREIGAAR